MSTRKDVAALAGVSTALVSYYINDNGYISEEKRLRIARAIEELDYRPNLIAKSLKMKDTKQLLFVSNEITNLFHAQLADGVGQCAYQEGYVTLFSSTINDPEYLKKICSYQVSGVLIATTNIDVDTINYMATRNIPIVLIGDKNWENLDKRVSKITIDYDQIMEELIGHVLSTDKRRIVYMAGGVEDKENIDRKTKAVRNVIARSKVDIDPVYFVNGVSNPEDAYEITQRTIQSRPKKPDIFICPNDSVAIGVLRAVYDLGLRVPEDVVVTGFNNTLTATMSIPSLTSVEIQIDQLTKLAVSMLIKKCNKEKVEDLEIKGKLIIRESTQGRTIDFKKIGREKQIE